jgi:hypothetical protein
MVEETSRELKEKWREARQNKASLLTQFKLALAYFIAFEREVDEASKIQPVSPEEQRIMDSINKSLGKGDKAGALQKLDDAFKTGIVPSVRYYQIRKSIEGVDYTPFVR